MKINKVVVIGSGTMGSGIAAQLCNANVPVTLLDLTTEISEKAVKAMKKMLPIIGQMQNDIEISGHTDDTDINNRFPSNWEMSVARASAIAGFLEANKIAPERMQVVGYGDSRPRFNADTAYKRALNRRVEILLLPEEQTR